MKNGINWGKVMIIVAVLAIIVAIVSSKAGSLFAGLGGGQTLTYSEFRSDVDHDPQFFKSVVIDKASNEATITFLKPIIPGQALSQSIMLPDSAQTRNDLYNALQKQGIKYNFISPWLGGMVQTALTVLLFPVGLLVLFYFLIMRQSQSGGNQALNFSKSRAKRLSDSVPKVTFKDVAGVDEAKQELEEIVEFLKNARKFQALGAKIPKGVLLLGPPGCGKTMLSRAIAGEAGVPFFHISGSDFVEMFVGVGASRVRDLFETAKANRPSLIFIDEIDAVGRQRGAGLGGGHDEREQTLNQLLVEMDGFDQNSGVIMIAATNRPDVLDPALLRPGRFDRSVIVDAPDVEGRKAIFGVHMRGKPISADINVETLARLTPGFTGADIMNMVNEAAILAARRNETQISMVDFDEARDRVSMGPERKSRKNKDKQLQIVAYHELGHAIVSANLSSRHDEVYKITVVPRGMSLGATWYLPKEGGLDSKQDMLEDITSLLGGRAAEEIVFNDVTTGASSDLDRATQTARAMVCEFGMSDRLGMVRLGKRHSNPFLGRDLMEDRDYSEDVARAIDEEVRAFIDGCYGRARDILTEHREKMDMIAGILIEVETLSREEFIALLNGTSTPDDIRRQRSAKVPPPPPVALPPAASQEQPRLQQLKPEPA